MQLQGQIKMIGDTQTFGASGFRKRELVLETAEQYPQLILVEFVQDKVEYLDKYKVGQDVDVSINLRGREWINPEGVAKYFNSIVGWRIAPQTEVQNTEHDNAMIEQDEPDDLPF